MKKKKTKLVAWRLSKQARAILAEAAKRSGLTKTQIVEISVAKHALETPGLAENAKKSLIEFIASQLGHNQESE